MRRSKRKQRIVIRKDSQPIQRRFTNEKDLKEIKSDKEDLKQVKKENDKKVKDLEEDSQIKKILKK